MSDRENAVSSYRAIRRYVERLASPAEEQLQWMDENGYTAGEMWDQLEDSVPSWFPFIRQYVDISEALEQALLQLLQILDATADAGVWSDSIEALRRPEWDAIREHASAALRLFGTAEG